MNITEIASFLGADWTASSVNDTLVRSSDNLTLILRENGYSFRGKIRISYSRPRRPDGQYNTMWENHNQVIDPSINVASSKSSEQVAKDISRRLLPEATRIHVIALYSVNENQKFLDGKENAIFRIASILGVDADKKYPEYKEYTGEVKPYDTKVASFKKNGYGKFKVNSADSISLELESMSFEVAAKVAIAIKEIFGLGK